MECVSQPEQPIPAAARSTRRHTERRVLPVKVAYSLVNPSCLPSIQMRLLILRLKINATYGQPQTHLYARTRFDTQPMTTTSIYGVSQETRRRRKCRSPFACYANSSIGGPTRLRINADKLIPSSRAWSKSPRCSSCRRRTPTILVSRRLSDALTGHLRFCLNCVLSTCCGSVIPARR
jgi:hypothetical protein